MLALMTPGFLLALGTQLFWSCIGTAPSLWKTALGANVIWGIPFGFLVMLAVWNRYDEHVEEAARDLGADQQRTFREVTLPLVWTGILGCFLFGFTLAWNDYDRIVLLVSGSETRRAAAEIGGLTFTGAIRPDLYALGHGHDALLAARDRLVLLAVAAAPAARRSDGPRVAPGPTEELGVGPTEHRRTVVVISTGSRRDAPRSGDRNLARGQRRRSSSRCSGEPDAPPLEGPRRLRDRARASTCTESSHSHSLGVHRARAGAHVAGSS